VSLRAPSVAPMYGPDLVTPTTEAFTWTPLLTGLPPVRIAASLAAPESPLLRPAELLASLARDFYSRVFNGLVTLPHCRV
jgi:hypothetical protein